MSHLKTKQSSSAASESQTSNPLIPSLMLYQLNHCAPLLCVCEQQRLLWDCTICADSQEPLLFKNVMYLYTKIWWSGSNIHVKPVLNSHSKIDKTKILKINGILMKVESIAECSLWSILQYFWPALRDNRSWKPILVFFFEWPLTTGFTEHVNWSYVVYVL